MPDFEALDKLTAHLRQTQMAADRRLTEVAVRLGQARRVVALTGAGISVASGIGTYRGAGGMWEDPELLEAHQVESLPGSLPIIWSVKGRCGASAGGQAQSGPPGAGQARGAVGGVGWRADGGHSEHRRVAPTGG